MEVLVHHANVIHRTGPNHTARHRRNLGFIYHGVSATKDAEANAKYERELTRNAIQDALGSRSNDWSQAERFPRGLLRIPVYFVEHERRRRLRIG